MNKTEKAANVEALHEKLAKATFVATVSYGKVDALTDIELRRAMRKAQVDWKVVKNTLALRAAKGTPTEKLSEHFTGPMAVAIAYGDVVQSAKAVTEAFKKAPDLLTLKGAVAEGAAMDAKGVEQLSKMPGIQELRSKLLGLLLQPATRLVQVINAPGASLARVLQANVDKGGEAPKPA
jgi:large subunit ribosomal protein L10